MLALLFKKKSQYALKLERILGFFPKNTSIYKQALTHKSLVGDDKIIQSNERLEFLGDSILSSVVSHYLFLRYPFKDEGFLTQLRSRFVSREMLNSLGKKIGLAELIEKKPEEKSLSILGNALEALIGAIYIDKGYEHARNFIEQKLIENHLDSEKIVAQETNFKSRVIEWCQKNKIPFEFETIEDLEGNQNIYTVTLLINSEIKGTGKAFSKKKAEQYAAEQFYNEITNET